MTLISTKQASEELNYAGARDWDRSLRLINDSFVTVATMYFHYVYHLIWTVIGVVGIFDATFKSIVTIVVIYSDHALLAYVAFPWF